MSKCVRLSAMVALAAGIWIAPQAASAAIMLELRPANQVVNVGDPADLGLYAVSDSSSNQLLSAADVIFSWDPAYLGLLGVDNTGAATGLISGFPVIDPWGNINDANPPTTGTGYYSFYAMLGSPVAATPSGTLLTTFVIDALAPTALTQFSILASGPGGSASAVYDGTNPNTPVTGSLGIANITILPEPASALLLLAGAMTLLSRRSRH